MVKLVKLKENQNFLYVTVYVTAIFAQVCSFVSVKTHVTVTGMYKTYVRISSGESQLLFCSQRTNMASNTQAGSVIITVCALTCKYIDLYSTLTMFRG